MRYVVILPVLLLNFSAAQAGGHKHSGYDYDQPTHFVDEDTWQKLFAAGSDPDPKKMPPKFREVYCDGDKPRFKVTRLVHFKPKVNEGTPVDLASIKIKKQQGMAPYYFQHDFFYSSGNGADLSEYLHTRTSDPKGNDNSSNLDRYVNVGDYWSFVTAHYERALEMAYLIEHFTFRLPPSAIKQMYGTPHDDFHINRFGYSKGSSFAASEAIHFKDYIWRYTLIHDVQVKSAPQGDGVDYQVTWTPDLFCKYSVSIDDLRM